MLSNKKLSIILKVIDNPKMRVSDSLALDMANEVVRLQRKVAELERLVPDNLGFVL